MSWIYVPGTDCRSSLAAAALIWASCSPSRVSTPAALSNGKNTRKASSLPRRKPDTSHPLQSGMTSPALTGAHCAGPSTRSLPDIPAKGKALQESVCSTMTHDGCGRRSNGSPRKSGLAGFSSKMSGGTLQAALKPCCEDYATWASRLQLASSQRQKRARRMSAADGSRSLTAPKTAGSWPTPMAGTPAQNGNSAAGNSDFSRRAEELGAKIWATPSSRDWKDTPGMAVEAVNPDGSVRNRMDQLPRMAQVFSRPPQATCVAGLPSWQWRPTSRRLLRSVTSRVALVSLRRWLRRGAWRRRKLSVLFVEWLMGWPRGHALSSCSAMEFSRWQQRMRGALSALPTACGPWIWQPPAEVPTEPEQVSFFDDLLQGGLE